MSEAIEPEIIGVLQSANKLALEREAALEEELREAKEFAQRLDASIEDIKKIADVARKLKHRRQLGSYMRGVVTLLSNGDRDMLERAMKDYNIMAIATIGRLINSDDENVALRASMFIVEMCHGKPTQRTEVLADKKAGTENVQKVLNEMSEEEIRRIAGTLHA